MTADLAFLNLLAVATIALIAPLLATALPVRVPSVVLEIVAGIVVGPSVLGWVTADGPVAVLALVGLSFLLFLSGLEIDLRGLRGDLLRLPLAGFLLSLALGVGVGVAARAVGWVSDPLFLAVALGATSLGIVAPLLKDGGAATGALGQFTLAGATVADFASILLLSLVFADAGGGAAARSIAVAVFAATVVAVAIGLGRAGRSFAVDRYLTRLQDTTAAIRVRVAVVILLGFVALAAATGLETILGAFAAGAVLALVDRDMTSHPHFRLKLESIGFGFLVPIFFVASGLRLDVRTLTEDPAALARVPVFLAALLVVRGLPALLYRGALGREGVITSALLQSTSLPFIVTATQIGVEIDAVAPVTAAALVAAGLMSTVLFPSIAAARLARSEPGTVRTPSRVTTPPPMGTTS